MLINIKLLKAAAIAVSKEETRYYLNGVCLQADEKNGVIFVATDGHRLLAFRQSETYEGEALNVIIPNDIIAAIKLNKKIDDGELTRDGDKWTLEYSCFSVYFKMIGGDFPDWRRFVPSECDGKPAAFNPKYYGDFEKVAKILERTGSCIQISYNGEGPSLIGFGDDVDGFGVIMPYRTRINELNKPDWAK